MITSTTISNEDISHSLNATGICFMKQVHTVGCEKGGNFFVCNSVKINNFNAIFTIDLNINGTRDGMNFIHFT